MTPNSGEHERSRSGERPFDVFVSSAIRDDLLPYRIAAKRALEALPGVRPWLFEDAPASGEPVAEGYLRRVAEADAVVLLLSGDTPLAVERELAEAMSSTRRLWIFVLPEALTPLSVSIVESVRERARYREIASPDELEHEISRAYSGDSIAALRAPAPLNRAALLDTVSRHSRARCVDRWRAAGLSLDNARRLAGDDSVGALSVAFCPTDRRRLVVLLGEFGSGKSLASERMLQTAVKNAMESATAPIPVFVRSIDIDGGLEFHVVHASVGLGDPRIDGAFIVIDGADEVDLSVAERVFRDARVLTEAWPRTTVVMTSRRLPVSGHHDYELAMPLLSEEGALRLVAIAAGRPIGASDWWAWPQSVHDAVRRPLFAILTGLFLAENGAAAPSKGDLLAFLVERAFKSTRTPVPIAQVALERLAQHVTDGREGVPLSELRVAGTLHDLVGSGLLQEQSGALSFGLPILGQWFAAHALLRGQPTITELVEGQRVDRWYYPLVIAVSIASEERADALLAELAHRDAGLAGKVVDESTARWGVGERVGSLTALDAGGRIRAAMLRWSDGIGPLREILCPTKQDGSLASLGVAVHQGRISSSWYMGSEALQPVVPLPRSLGPFIVAPGEVNFDWPRLKSGAPGASPAWNWRWSMDELRHDLKEIMKLRSLPSDNPILAGESAWLTACSLLKRGDLYYSGIPLARLAQELERHLEGTLPIDTVVIRGSFGREHNLSALRSFLTDSLPENMDLWTLDRPLPDQPLGGWIWSVYSPAALAALLNAILRDTVEAYSALVDRWFPCFAPRMQHYQLLPARFTGCVAFGAEEERHGPVYSLRVEPLPVGSVSTFGLEIEAAPHRPSYDDLDGAIERCKDLRPAAAAWLFPVVMESLVHDEFHVDAVTRMTYKWLQSDLEAIRWVSR